MPISTFAPQTRQSVSSERAYRLEDNILKFLTVHLEKELVPAASVEALAQETDGGRI